MKTLLLPLVLLCALTTATAQTTIVSTELQPPVAGQMEFSIGGNGAVNKDFNDSAGGVNFALGRYFSSNVIGLIRQTVNYANPQDSDVAWSGSTRLAVDQLFGDGKFRPFLGVNFGRVYGDGVRDTWAAGLETGAKYYVQPRTFIQATIEYGWFFQHSRSIEDRFDDGQWNWSLGVGFNF